MKKKLIIAIFSINLVIIVLSWYFISVLSIGSGSLGAVFLLIARLSGLLAAYLLLWQLLLIGRVKFIEQAIGQDKLSRYHHYNGVLILPLLILHILTVTISYAQFSNQGFASQFWAFVSGPYELFWTGFAFIVLVVVALSSMWIAKKKLKYEAWYLVHLLSYLGILLAYNHQVELGGDLRHIILAIYWYLIFYGTLIVFVYFRFFKQVYSFYKHRFYVADIKVENDKVVSVYIQGRNLSNFSIKPGQFMNFRFLNKSLWFESHPFSWSESKIDNHLRISIKSLGDFSSTLKNKLKINDPVLIDGPYGVFTGANIKNNKFLLIAGGIGITPIRSMIGKLIEQQKDVVLIYANNFLNDLLFANEFSELEAKGLKLIKIFSSEPNYVGEQGRIDSDKIARLVPDFLERDIFVCGPPSLMNQLLEVEFKKLQIDKQKIHFEKFSF